MDTVSDTRTKPKIRENREELMDTRNIDQDVTQRIVGTLGLY